MVNCKKAYNTFVISSFIVLIAISILLIINSVILAKEKKKDDTDKTVKGMYITNIIGAIFALLALVLLFVFSTGADKKIKSQLSSGYKSLKSKTTIPERFKPSSFLDE